MATIRSGKSLELRVGEGANWVSRNAIARRSASLKISVDGTLLSVPFFAPAQVGRMNA